MREQACALWGQGQPRRGQAAAQAAVAQARAMVAQAQAGRSAAQGQYAANEALVAGSSEDTDPSVMAVKARIAALQKLLPGEHVGYGMRYTATEQRRIAVLPIGYGDGFPRVRNQGYALLHGKRAPIIGGIAMDALMVDVTDIPEAQMWDEAVLMGEQGNEVITARAMAQLKNSVTYDVLTGWRLRLRRKCVNGKATP